MLDAGSLLVPVPEGQVPPLKYGRSGSHKDNRCNRLTAEELGRLSLSGVGMVEFPITRDTCRPKRWCC